MAAAEEAAVFVVADASDDPTVALLERGASVFFRFVELAGRESRPASSSVDLVANSMYVAIISSYFLFFSESST